MKFATIAATLVLWSLSITGALAGSLSVCKTCQGSVYSLTYEMVAQNFTGDLLLNGKTLTLEHEDVVRVFYDIDSSHYSPSQPTTGKTYIDQVAQKVSSSINDSYLESAPNGIENWQLVIGGINANGCSSKGGGFECANWVTKAPIGVQVPDGALLRWVFVETIATGSLFLGTTPNIDMASIKARYVAADGTKVGDLVSENIQLTGYVPPGAVPEPASITLLTTVVTAFALAFRSRSRNTTRSRSRRVT